MDNKEMWSRHISGIKADISVVCEKKIEKKKNSTCQRLLRLFQMCLLISKWMLNTVQEKNCHNIYFILFSLVWSTLHLCLLNPDQTYLSVLDSFFSCLCITYGKYFQLFVHSHTWNGTKYIYCTRNVLNFKYEGLAFNLSIFMLPPTCALLCTACMW